MRCYNPRISKIAEANIQESGCKYIHKEWNSTPGNQSNSQLQGRLQSLVSGFNLEALNRSLSLVLEVVILLPEAYLSSTWPQVSTTSRLVAPPTPKYSQWARFPVATSCAQKNYQGKWHRSYDQVKGSRSNQHSQGPSLGSTPRTYT